MIGDEKPTPVGSIADQLGVTVRLAPGEQVTDMVVIAKVASPELGTDSRVSCCYSDGLDWVVRLGMLTVADAAMEGTFHCGSQRADGDDE